MPDETVLRVGTRTDPGSLAGAVFKSLERGDVVKARAFGAAATFTMLKGVALARRFFENHGKRLYLDVDTASEQLDDGYQIRSVTLVFYVSPEEEALQPGLS